MKPIPIIGQKKNERTDLTAEEWLAWRKQRHDQNVQWGLLLIFGLLVLGAATPLVLWLSRIALGG